MSIRGNHVALAMLFVSWCGCLAAGCKGGGTEEETKQAPAAVEATAVPTPAPTEAAATGEVDYEDSLVLLADGEPDSGVAPLDVQFEVESLVVDEIGGAKYTWDFGDGSPKSNEASPKHTYQKPGEYTATIGIVDASGERGWDEVDIFVDEPEGEE